ncbi:universal stress protein [Streptomyces sp. NPDC052040]|uniref:universal stress protein n=1 Tax=unclassified Streptomyces TaxID=2593676 RepID=UPI0037D82BA0
MGSAHRVIVGVSGSPANLAALRWAVAEARRTDAPLVPVLAWSLPGDDTMYYHLLDELHKSARERLDQAFEEAFGGYPDDLDIHSMSILGAAGPALVETAGSPSDLLVVGTGHRSRLRRLIFPSVSRYCLARAECPVIAVPPPALLRELSLMARVTRKMRVNDASKWIAMMAAPRS